MRFKSIFALLAVAAAFAAKGDYLYWQVTGAGEDVAWAALKLDGSYVDGAFQVTGGSMAGYSKYNVGSVGENQTFLIELLNSSGTAVLWSEGMTYSQLSEFIGTGDLVDVPAANIWHGSNYSNVPEPTGGLLALVGIGLLALRRRKGAV